MIGDTSTENLRNEIDGSDGRAGSASDAADDESPIPDDARVDSAMACTDAAGCQANEYCSSRGLCEACTDIVSADLSAVEFSEPEPLSAVNAGAGDDALRFPRIFDEGSKLVYEHLFSERGENCQPGSPFSTDLGLVRLNAAGQPAETVVPVNVNKPSATDTDASLSPDMCWMYFASARDTTGNTRLYRARRAQ